MKVGDTVGNYRVVARLGRGGHGDVWLAEHALVGKRVAVKVIAAARAARAEGRERFLVEARAVAEITHPHIVQLFDFGVSDGGDLYFTMEHLEGRSLGGLLHAEKRLPVGRALRIAAQVADALAAAHARHVIHRDLKPDNVFLVDSDGAAVDRVKVLDFGLARRMDSSFTAEGALLGTPEYMAPEQCAARRDLDGRADVYALGCLLYELIDGAPPFCGDAQEVLRAQRGKLPVPLTAVGPRVWALIERALAKSRNDRFPTMVALRDALTDEAGSTGAILAVGGGTPGSPLAIAPSDAITVDRDVPALPTSAAQRAPKRTPRHWPLALAVAAVLVAAAPVVWHWRHRPTPASALPQTASSTRRTLAIRSTPTGATVVVDGIGYGATPVEIALEGPGEIEVALAGFTPWRSTVDPARAATIDAQLTPLPPPPKVHPITPRKQRSPTKPPDRLTDKEGLLRPSIGP